MDQKKGDPIVRFVWLRLKFLAFTVVDGSEFIPKIVYTMYVRHKSVAICVLQSKMKRFIYED